MDKMYFNSCVQNDAIADLPPPKNGHFCKILGNHHYFENWYLNGKNQTLFGIFFLWPLPQGNDSK